MQPGQFVNVHLTDPAERYWGRLDKLFEAGVVLRGIDVGQIEQFKHQFRKDQRLVYPQTLFFPMRRIHKIDLDEPMDVIPSVIDEVKQISKLSEDEILQ